MQALEQLQQPADSGQHEQHQQRERQWEPHEEQREQRGPLQLQHQEAEQDQPEVAAEQAEGSPLRVQGH
jgi:hypothetical protein